MNLGEPDQTEPMTQEQMIAHMNAVRAEIREIESLTRQLSAVIRKQKAEQRLRAVHAAAVTQ